MSSFNQSLLDEQPSNAISRSFVDLDQEDSEANQIDLEDIDNNRRDVKEAIIDLYLAIKIRSTEELDKINEYNLHDEKKALLQSVSSFQILEYIRSSIEIIMNLKIEDLEKNENKGSARKGMIPPISANLSEMSVNIRQETTLSELSVESRNLIQQSMKDALVHMIENNESKDFHDA